MKRVAEWYGEAYTFVIHKKYLEKYIPNVKKSLFVSISYQTLFGKGSFWRLLRNNAFSCAAELQGLGGPRKFTIYLQKIFRTSIDWYNYHLLVDCNYHCNITIFAIIYSFLVNFIGITQEIYLLYYCNHCFFPNTR